MVMKLLLLIIGCIGSLYPIVSYHLFNGPEERRVLIFGNHHDKVFSFSSRHTRAVIDDLEKMKFTQPMVWVMTVPKMAIYVAPEAHVMLLKHVQSHPNKVSLVSVEQKFHNNQLLYVLSAKLTSYIEELFTTIQRGDGRPYWRKEDSQIKFDAIRQAAQKPSLLTDFTYLTVSGYLKEITGYLATLGQSKNRLPKEAQKIYEELILMPYRTACKEIQEEFGSYKGLLFEEAFWLLFLKKCSTPEDLITFFVEFKNRHLGIIDTQFVTAEFFKSILTQKPDPLCCIFVGIHEAEGLKQLFEKMPGWSLIKEESIWERRAGDGIAVASNLAPQFLSGLLTTLNEHIKPIVRTCAVCNKTENLGSCAQCLAVYYCGIACQKSAWLEHKKACVPVQVKVEVPS
jgi:hypothetical protein